MKEWMKAVDLTVILSYRGLLYLFSFPRYGHFKMPTWSNQISNVKLWSCWMLDLRHDSVGQTSLYWHSDRGLLMVRLCSWQQPLKFKKDILTLVTLKSITTGREYCLLPLDNTGLLMVSLVCFPFVNFQAFLVLESMSTLVTFKSMIPNKKYCLLPLGNKGLLMVRRQSPNNPLSNIFEKIFVSEH